MIRTFNYTGRKRIPQSQIQLNITEPHKGLRVLDTTVQLDNLALPAEASVYVEAYSRTGGVKRYLFGKVSKFNPPEDLSIPDPVSIENLHFRVLVVDESGLIGRIVAVADRLRLKTAEIGLSESILPVELDDLGKLVWRVDFGEERPTLVLNYNIPDIKHVAASDPRFFEYVYPAVLKEILTHMVWIEGMDASDDMDIDDWCLQWLRFTNKYVQADGRPELNKESLEFDPEAARQWIDDVVEEFCTSHAEQWEALQKELEVTG